MCEPRQWQVNVRIAHGERWMEKENACIFVQLFAFAFKYNVRIERQRMEGSGRCTPPLYPGVVPQAEEGYSVGYNTTAAWL